MSSAAEKFLEFQKTIPTHVKIVAVSKTKPVEDILSVYETGQRAFGENKIQELSDKAIRLPEDIEWHAIGHLQTNKVKYIAPFVHLIHAVDSLKLLKVIQKEALKNKRKISCLFQVHIAEEQSKFGFSEDDLIRMLEGDEWKKLDQVNICGLMGMATFTDDKEKVKNEFRRLYSIFKRLKTNYFSSQDQFCEISMGMSGDYELAIEEGATIIRVGSTIFGERNY